MKKKHAPQLPFAFVAPVALWLLFAILIVQNLLVLTNLIYFRIEGLANPHVENKTTCSGRIPGACHMVHRLR
jgi:hypothetical protein